MDFDWVLIDVPLPSQFLQFYTIKHEAKRKDKYCSRKRNLTLNNKPFPKRQILDSSKMKEFADDNFIFDEYGRKFSKWIENTVGKGEIARYEQFLLFPVFSKDLFC